MNVRSRRGALTPVRVGAAPIARIGCPPGRSPSRTAQSRSPRLGPPIPTTCSIQTPFLRASELVILSRKRIDNDGPKSACQSTNFQMTQWVRTISAARTASAFVARLAARSLNPVARQFRSGLPPWRRAGERQHGNTPPSNENALPRVPLSSYRRCHTGCNRSSDCYSGQPVFAGGEPLNVPEAMELFSGMKRQKGQRNRPGQGFT